MDNVKIKVENGHLLWLTKEEVKNKIELNEVKVIAEYSTPDGKNKGDWFLKLILSENMSYELSMYTENIDQILYDLGKSLDVSYEPALDGKKDWNSNIMFPNSLQGQPLWHIEVIPPRGILDWLKTFLFLGKRLDFRLTNSVNKLLNASK